MTRLLPAVYLRLRAALCCVTVVVHLIGEQGHEEREAAGVSGAGLGAVERLGGNTAAELPLVINQTISSFIVKF